MTTFIRAGYKQIYNYINGINNITLAQLDELASSLSVSVYLITDTITTWKN